MSCQNRRIFGLVLATALALILSAGSFAQSPKVIKGTQKKVLAFYLLRRDGLSAPAPERTYQKALTNGLAGQLDYYGEYVDMARFGGDEYQSALRDFLKQKYKGINFDLIIASADLRNFLARYGPEIFPKTPVVFSISDDSFDNTPTPPNFTGLVYETDLRGTLDIILRLQPGTKRVFVVTGASPVVDKFQETRARKQFEQYGDRLAFTYLTGLPLDELKNRVSSLPPDSVIYFLQMTEDGAGSRFTTTDSLDQIAEAANVPIYTWHDSNLGHGVVGGKLISSERTAGQTAELALRILRGERVETIPITRGNVSRLEFDWRQLQRWKLSEERLPAGSEVLFREVTFWQRYSRWIIGVAALLALQSALIVALLAERQRRRTAIIGFKESEERNQAILSALPDMMFMQSMDGVYIDYHASKPELLLLPPEQFIGKRMQEVLPHGLAREIESRFARAIETGETQILEYEVSINGMERWFEARIAPSSETRMLSVIRDVTDRRQAEEDLRKSEERFAQLFKVCPQPMSLATLDEGRYVDVNDSFLAMSGYRREEVIGHTSLELQVWESPEEREQVINKLKGFGAIHNLEKKFRCKNGELRILLLSAELLNHRGELLNLVAGSDITELKQLEQQLTQSERQFSTLVENSPDVISRLDKHLRYIYVSPSLQRISGIATEAFIGKTPGEVALSDYDWSGFECCCREAIVKKQTVAREFQYRGRHYRTRIIPEYSAGGEVESVMALSEDLTERVRTEFELRKLTARLFTLQDEERRRIARELHDGTAQDIFAITLNLQRLGRETSNPTAEIRGLINDSQQLAAQSLIELRTLSYLLHPPVLDDAGLVRALQWFVRGFSERSGIYVDTIGVQDIGRLPLDIETALFRVVQESLTNIRRHSGSDRASIRLEKREAEVTLQISDCGHGMPENTRDGSAAAGTELGVGIPGMRQRLIQLGGRLEIESTTKGTTLTAVISVVQAAPVGQQASA